MSHRRGVPHCEVLQDLLVNERVRSDRSGPQRGRGRGLGYGLAWVERNFARCTGHWPTPNEVLDAAAGMGASSPHYVAQVWLWLTARGHEDARRRALMAQETPWAYAERWRTLLKIDDAEGDYGGKVSRGHAAMFAAQARRWRWLLGHVGPHDVRAAALVSKHDRLRGMVLVEVRAAHDDCTLVLETEDEQPLAWRRGERRAYLVTLNDERVLDIEPTHPRGDVRQRVESLAGTNVGGADEEEWSVTTPKRLLVDG